MIIATSFLTRDDAHFVALVFTLDNYSRLLDPLYFDVLLHSLNMALIATVACGAGVSLRVVLARLPQKSARCCSFTDCAVLDQLLNSHLRAENFPQHQRLSERVSAVAGVIDTPIRIMFTPGAVIIGLVYILLPFMVMPLYSSIEKLDKPLLEAAKDLGANKLQTFIRIIIPLTMRHYRRLSAGDASGDGLVLRL